MFRDEWRWCHHKTEIGVDWAMFKRNFWRQVTCHDIYVLDECKIREAAIFGPYRSRTFTRSPRRKTLVVGSSSSGAAATAAPAGGAHDVASGAPSAIVVWCVAWRAGNCWMCRAALHVLCIVTTAAERNIKHTTV